MQRFLMRLVVNSVGLWVIDLLWRSIWVTPAGGGNWQKVAVYLGIGLLLTLVNYTVKPVVKVLAIPVMILTLGLFALIVNAAMLELVSAISAHTPMGLHIESFGSAVGAGLVLALVTAILGKPARDLERAARAREQ
ncbi:MAG: phage holin family protein [Micrococcales bacterium]|nr:phage holin family protein [Micrococcales bacterium]